MTTNEDRAAEIIATATTPPGTSITRGMDRAILATKLLADAGLLMSDLPEPEYDEDGRRIWVSGTFSITAGNLALPGTVAIRDSEPGGVLYIDPTSAREHAAALLAAANHAEQEHK